MDLKWLALAEIVLEPFDPWVKHTTRQTTTKIVRYQDKNKEDIRVLIIWTPAPVQAIGIDIRHWKGSLH